MERFDGVKFMNVMPESITSKLKNNKTLILWKRWVHARLSGKTGSSRHNILTEFSCFSPLSVGNYKANAALTIQSVNSTFPSLCSFLEASGQKKTGSNQGRTVSKDR